MLSRVVVLAAVASGFVIAACGGDDEPSSTAASTEAAAAAPKTCADVDLTKPPAEPQKIRWIGGDGALLYTLTMTLEEKLPPESARKYQDKFYTLDTSSARGNQDAFAAFQSGNADAFTASMPSYWIANATNVPVVAVATTGIIKDGSIRASEFWTAKDSDIDGYEDLAGKTLAIADFKSKTDMQARAAVAAGGHDPDDAKYVVMDLPVQLPAAADGRVDLGFAAEPLLAIEKAKGKIRFGVSGLQAEDKLAKANGALLEQDADLVMVGKDFLEQHPEAVCAFIADLNGTTNWLRDNQKEAREGLLAANRIVAPKDVLLALPDLPLPDDGLPINVENQRRLVDLALQLGIIEENQKPNLDELISSFANTK